MSKKYLSITFALAVLLSFFGFDFGFEKANNRMNYQAVGAENSAEDGFVARNSLYEFKHFSTVKNSKDNQPYYTPYDFNKTNKTVGGATNCGTFKISGAKIEDRGYKTAIETGLFDYNYYSVQSQVRLSISFNYNIQDTGKFIVSDCKSNTIDNLKTSEIKKGVCIIYKRTKESNTWNQVFSVNPSSNVDKLEYAPDGNDIEKGVFFRYVVAYQYYQKVGNNKYQYYDVYQRSTVYLVTGGTSLKFETNVLKETEYDISTATYRNYNLEGSDTFVMNDSTLVENNEICHFQLKGEILEASKAKNDYCSDFPEFVYNGIKKTINVQFNINTSYSQIYRTIRKIKTNDADEEQLNSEIPSSGIRVEKLNSDNKWELANSEAKRYSFTTPISISIDDFTNNDKTGNSMNYSQDLRALYLSSFNINGKDVSICNVTYFRVKLNFDKYKSAFENSNGMDTAISMIAKPSDISKGITLEDGSASFSNIAVMIPSSSYKVELSYNDGNYESVKPNEDDLVFYEKKGRYRFRVTNLNSETSIKTLYIVDIKDYNGKSTYFKDGKFIDDNKRLYDPESSIPSYAPGAQFQINGDQFKPGIYGDISLVNNDGSLKKLVDIYNLHTIMTGTLTEIGQYQATIHTSDPTTTGDHIKYTIRFNIKNGSDFVPRINYDLLHSGVDCRNLMGKGYVVKFQSKGTGSYLFTFPYTQKGFHDAWDFSERVEARKVVYSEDKKHYTYNGVEYDSKFELYDDIHENASKLISTTLINKKFSVEGDGYELKNIAEKPIDHDIYVVTSEDVFKELSTDLVYINDYMFQQVREYESSSVEIIFPDGKTKKKIDYKVSVNSYLGESGIYTVVEKNPYGERRYQVAYCKNGDNKTTTTIRYFDQTNRIVEKEFGKNSQTKNITTTSLIFKNVVDAIDPVTLVTVTRKEDNSVHYYSGEELIDCVIDYKGTYQIEFTNRMGYSFLMTANIIGEKNSKGIMPHKDADSELSYCPIGHTKGVN